MERKPELTRGNRPGRSAGQEGYVLLVFLLFSALLVIGLLRTLPSLVVQSQREREEEHIFRGQQYQRAIQLFVRKFGRYPNSLEELEETNDLRFLRKRFPDILTRDGEWRLIHIGPGGTFPDALTVQSPPSPSPSSASGEPDSSASPGTPPDAGSLANPSASSPTEASPGSPLALFQSGAAASGQSSQEPAFRPSADPTANPQQQPRAAGTAQAVFGGGGIAGVASQNTASSIKVWNGEEQYNRWEFIYNFQTDPAGLAAVARVSGVAAPPGAQPAAGGQPGAQPSASPQQPAVQQTPFSPPRWLGGPAPGVRPGTPGQFPPSPIPQPAPRSRQP